MIKRPLSVLVTAILMMVIAACGSTTEPDEPIAEVTQVRIAYDSSVGMGKIPSLLAWEELRAQGIEVIPTFYPDSVTAIQAVLAGEADVGDADPVVVIQANLSGQNLRIFALEQNNQFAMVTPTSITSPEQLDGMRVAYHSPGSMTRALAFLAAEEYGFEPEYLVIEGSEVRAEALMNGQLDGTVVDLENAVLIDLARPGEFQVLIPFAEDFPGLMGNGLYAPQEYIAENGDTLQAMVEAMLVSHRRINDDPEYFKTQIPKFIPGIEQEPERLEGITNAYLDANVFDVNGGFTEEAAAATVDLYVEVGDLESAVPFEEWGTRDILEAALEELGER